MAREDGFGGRVMGCNWWLRWADVCSKVELVSGLRDVANLPVLQLIAVRRLDPRLPRLTRFYRS